MLTLKYFNAVLAKPVAGEKPFMSDQGFVIEPGAIWAKDHIIDFYTRESLSGRELNKTFHKSWKKIQESPRVVLLVEQILHYLSTYGSNFQDEMYIPAEVLDVPDVKLKYKAIRALSKGEMTDKALGLLKSGIALTEDTVDGLISILVDELDYRFTGKEGIRNKEAVVKIAEMYHVYPDNPVEFFRFVLYRTTDTTLLIKSNEVIQLIKEGGFNPGSMFKEYGLSRLAEIFNRFKPLFLAYKGRCPKVINKIAKLSKTYHKPLVVNPLNEVTHREIGKDETHWLDNATPFALFKALSACRARSKGQDAFVYRIRNGKSWAKENYADVAIASSNCYILMRYMQKRFSLEGKTFFFPKNVEYALPTSEKLYVGNVPVGTKFSGKKLAVGIYWENDWGAHDLDLSGMNISGKVGWNSAYRQGDGELMYSGDITNAPNGAVEYLYAQRGLSDPTLVMNNVYSGDPQSGYKIIVGKGDKVDKAYMMNPNRLMAEVKCNSVQQNTVLGMFLPENGKQHFVLLNFGAGHARVSGSSETSQIATKALYQQWSDPLSFVDIVKKLGGTIVNEKENAEHDFSLDNLEKDSFVRVFQK